MTVHLVTFSDESMSRARELCTTSAIRHGCNTATARDLNYLREFQCFREDWVSERGLGWWYWKPLIIGAEMQRYLDGSIVVYADAGVEFIAPVSHIIERMDQDIFLFGNNWEHHHWCKQSVIEVIWPVRGVADVETRMKIDRQRFGKQCQASVIFFRVSDYSRAFVAEWLKWCLWNNGELIDDSPSWIGNHPEFREHRHDQAILTTMAYREGLHLHAWPAVYNRFLGQEFIYSREGYPETDNYPSLFHHHRLRNNEFEAIGIKL